MAKTLVLGANGFIGSHLVDSLSTAGHTVRAFSHYGSSDVKFHMHENVEIFQGDFLNKADIEAALDGIDYVFHFLSTSTPVSTEDDPFIDIETNVRMSVELFHACTKAQVKRVIYASTGGAIYGSSEFDGNRLPVRYKESDPLYPISPYAIGKLSIERYLKYFKVKKDLSSLILRISNPYGERQPFYRKQGVIPIFIENVYLGKPITLMGDGSATRDYIYVKDLTDAVCRMFDRGLKYDTYNIGSGTSTSLETILKTIESVVGRKANVKYVDTPSTYVEHVSLDTTLINDEIGEIASTNLREGMEKTYAYIKSHMDKKI